MARKVKSSIHMLGFIIEKFFKKNKKKKKGYLLLLIGE